jgi:PhzF family phenazine biosynthesis protein
MDVFVRKVLSFSDKSSGGNPAGVVLDSPDLSDSQMKGISSQLKVSETAFLFPSKKADFFVRFFSPIVEVDLCGHATVASFFTVGSLMQSVEKDNVVLYQETKAGILPVYLYFKQGRINEVMMAQQKLIYESVDIDYKILANTLLIDENDIEKTFSSHRVSTGLFTLPVCVSSFDVLESIKPDFDKIRTFCQLCSVGSLHVFTFETIEENSLYHARNFAPVYGILEDPVTGTANGAVSSYLYKKGVFKHKIVICEQGDIIGKGGRVFIDLSGSEILVGGKAFIDETFNMKF